MTRRSDFHILAQPDGATCGPTCLQALYRYYGDDLELTRIAEAIPQLDDGGVMAVQLACHALRRGYQARIYTYNLQMFDPSWFREPRVDLRAKLVAQAKAKSKRKLQFATTANLEFLDLGGQVDMQDLTPGFLRELLETGAPVLTGLSSTWLYRSAREVGVDPVDDDVRGAPQGHFVVLFGWEPRLRHVFVADPLRPNPFSEGPVYAVDVERLVAAILLGILTYDANLLVVRPRAG